MVGSYGTESLEERTFAHELAMGRDEAMSRFGQGRAPDHLGIAAAGAEETSVHLRVVLAFGAFALR